MTEEILCSRCNSEIQDRRNLLVALNPKDELLSFHYRCYQDEKQNPKTATAGTFLKDVHEFRPPERHRLKFGLFLGGGLVAAFIALWLLIDHMPYQLDALKMYSLIAFALLVFAFANYHNPNTYTKLLKRVEDEFDSKLQE